MDSMSFETITEWVNENGEKIYQISNFRMDFGNSNIHTVSVNPTEAHLEAFRDDEFDTVEDLILNFLEDLYTRSKTSWLACTNANVMEGLWNTNLDPLTGEPL